MLKWFSNRNDQVLPKTKAGHEKRVLAHLLDLHLRFIFLLVAGREYGQIWQGSRDGEKDFGFKESKHKTGGVIEARSSQSSIHFSVKGITLSEHWHPGRSFWWKSISSSNLT